MSKSEENTCLNCRFRAVPHSNDGPECRLVPPVAVPDYNEDDQETLAGMVYEFPAIVDEHWCGQWARRPDERGSVEASVVWDWIGELERGDPMSAKAQRTRVNAVVFNMKSALGVKEKDDG